MESLLLHHHQQLLLPHLSLSPSSHILNPNAINLTRHLTTHRLHHSPPVARRTQLVASAPTSSHPQFPEHEARHANSDLAPTPPSERTFTAWDLASLWVGLVVGVPSYYLAGSLVGLGMAWWQAVSTVAAANLILLAPLVLTGAAGARYGVPFPVLARSAFGVRGAHVPALLRALVGCGWYGIESWIGGEAVFLLLPASLKSSPLATKIVPILGTDALRFSCFIAFWAAQLAIILRGVDGIRELEKFAAPILILLTTSLLLWAYVKAGSFGSMLSLPPRLTGAEFRSVFFPSLTANVSFWATVALNIPDFTRYARSQKDQVLGQIGLPVFMGLFTLVGIAVTSATEVIFGQVISDPIQLLGRIGGFWTTLIAIFGISLATITTNIAANVVAPANALVNLNPNWFTFRRGAVLTALLGIAFQPWRLLKTSESFVYTWLVGYSALLGPIAGIVLADYYLVQGRELDVGDLYSRDPAGRYYYLGGFNVGALVAMAAGILPVVPGFLCEVGILSKTWKPFVVAYNNAWFVGFFASGFVYWALMTMRKKRV